MENEVKYKLNRNMIRGSQMEIIFDFIKEDLERLGIEAKVTYTAATILTYWIYFKDNEDMLFYRLYGRYEIDNKVLWAVTDKVMEFIDEVIGEPCED